MSLIIIRGNKSIFITILLLILAISSNVSAFISREYTLEEIVHACSNLIFGKVTLLDSEKMYFVVDAIENIKGETQFKQIKISVAIGQSDCPKQLMGKLHTGIPIVIFYIRQGQKRIEALGYVSGLWIRLFAIHDNPKGFEWYFTYLEKYMKRTFDGDTVKMQSSIREMLTEKESPNPADDKIKVLCYANEIEYLFLNEIKEVGGETISYQLAGGRTLSHLEGVDLLWIGNGKIEDTLATKQKLENYLKRGGIVVVTSKKHSSKWMPEFLIPVNQSAYNNFKPTNQSGELFTSPNQIRPGSLCMENTWKRMDKNCRVLATTKDQGVAFAIVKYGDGMCLLTSLLTEKNSNLLDNAPMLENLVYFVVKRWQDEKHKIREQTEQVTNTLPRRYIKHKNEKVLSSSQ